MPDLYQAPKIPPVGNLPSDKGIQTTAATNRSDQKETPVVTKPAGDTAEVKNPLSGLSEKNIRSFLPRKSGHSLSSLLVLPSKKVTFETQDPQEEILLILRSHWLTNLPWVLTSLLLFVAPYVLIYFPLLSAFPSRFQLAAVVIWYLVILMYVYESFLHWFFNLCIITDERIVDVELESLTSRRISDADIEKIQDVTYKNTGVFGTVFNFGNVNVQTAAEVAEFVFEDVPKPDRVADILQKLRTEEKIEAIEGRIR